MKYLVLGAGPAGLSFANRLKQNGENDFLVLEKEHEAGGLCRSVMVDGAPFDIGGGHFLDVRRPAVNDFLFGFMPREEWQLFERDSRIALGKELISHPLEANIWQMDLERQIAYLKSIAAAGCNLGKEEQPEKFVDWIRWKLGDQIAEDYMIPYNQKMFGENLNELGTYWLSKLPDVSFEDTLRSCLTRKAHAKQPGHASFYYPKHYGYGELWLRMAEAISEHMIYEKAVVGIDFNQKSVRCADGASYTADVIVTTVPWAEFQSLAEMPEEIRELAGGLKHTGVWTQYVPQNMDTEAQWIYYPAKELAYHRILVRHNFCAGSRGVWTETNAERFEINGNTTTPDDVDRRYGSAENCDTFCYLNQYAYPLNTVQKPYMIERLLGFGKEKGVFGLGRWGEHEHYNSDVTVERALCLADQFCGNAG